MSLAHFRVLIHKLLNKDREIVPEEALIIVLDLKSSMCIAKNSKDTKQTKHIARRPEFFKEWIKLQDAQD